MIKFIVNSSKDLFHIVDKRNREDDKKYRLSDIALMRLDFYDDTETDGFICVYLKSDISKVCCELPFTGFDFDNRESILEICFSCKNQIDISGYDDVDYDIHEIFSDLITVSARYNIEIVSPNDDYSLATRYFEWLEQKKVELWWKDDFIFRNYFSRN